jgi:hypothetical protein
MSGCRDQLTRASHTPAPSSTPPTPPPNHQHHQPKTQQLFGGGAAAGGPSSSNNNGKGVGRPNSSSAKKRNGNSAAPPLAVAALAAAGLAAAGIAALRRRGASASPSAPAARRGRGGLPAARMHGGAEGAVGTSTAVAEHAEAAPAAAAAPTPHSSWRPPIDPAFEGTWIKLKDRSTSMDAALDALHLTGLPRRAAALVRGVAVHLHPHAAAAPASRRCSRRSSNSSSGSGKNDDNDNDDDEAPPLDTEFEFAVFSPLPLLKVRERYVIDGPTNTARRRDLRRGHHTARAVSADGGKGLRLEIEWPAPFGGKGVDDFRINSAGELVISSELWLDDGGHVTFFAVHRRK